MKRIVCLFLLLSCVIDADDGLKVKTLPVQIEEQMVSLQDDAILHEKEYAELLVSIAPKQLADRVDQYIVGDYTCPLLLLNPQGLGSSDVCEAFAQIQNVPFLCIDSKYFDLTDNTTFFSSIKRDVTALLKKHEDLIVIIDRVDLAGHDTKKSWRIDTLIKLLQRKPIMIVLTANEKKYIDDAIMNHLQSMNIFDGAHFSFDARAKIIRFYFKEKIDANIVDEQLIQTITKKTGDFSYTCLVHLINEINDIIDDHLLQKISESDVMPIINEFQENIKLMKNSGKKSYFKEMNRFIKEEQIIPQLISDFAGVIVVYSLYKVIRLSVEKLRKKSEKYKQEVAAMQGTL